VFAVLAGLSQDTWGHTVSGFLDHSIGGAGRIESATLASSVGGSFLTLNLTPTMPPKSRGILLKKVLLSDFRNGYVTGLLLALPVVQALMDGGTAPRNLAPPESQLSCEQAVGLNRLLIAAKSHLRPLPIERRQDLGGRRNLTTGRMEVETAG
jgi:hypothetical protein